MRFRGRSAAAASPRLQIGPRPALTGPRSILSRRALRTSATQGDQSSSEISRKTKDRNRKCQGGTASGNGSDTGGASSTCEINREIRVPDQSRAIEKAGYKASPPAVEASRRSTASIGAAVADSLADPDPSGVSSAQIDSLAFAILCRGVEAAHRAVAARRSADLPRPRPTAAPK